MITEQHVPTTSPLRVIAELDHRLEVLGGGYGNDSEIRRIEAERDRWRIEAEAIRRQRAEHHAHMSRLHRQLAGDHHRRLLQLQAERGEEVVAGAENTNGSS